MDLHRIGFKFFVTDDTGIDLLELIPIFHRWIQTRALEDLLIDVADYSHVHAGPGIMLIAHEGNYAMDETGNRRGLVYYGKRPLAGSLSQRLVTVCERTLKACQRLEQEPEFKGRLKFRGDQLQVFANDRLVAPNDDQTLEAFKPALTELLGILYQDADTALVREPDPKERFAVTVKTATPLETGDLLGRLEA